MTFTAAVLSPPGENQREQTARAPELKEKPMLHERFESSIDLPPDDLKALIAYVESLK